MPEEEAVAEETIPTVAKRHGRSMVEHASQPGKRITEAKGTPTRYRQRTTAVSVTQTAIPVGTRTNGYQCL